MRGYKALWVPGTDRRVATENVVLQKIQREEELEKRKSWEGRSLESDRRL